MESDLGVEVDCSIGGMNGADTSLYAFKMSEKYKRFVIAQLQIREVSDFCLTEPLLFCSALGRLWLR